MREIKFRAYVKNHWIGNNEKGEPMIYDWQDTIYPEAVTFQPEDVPIMQYTGLKDKNGKEIYEGDIVRFNIPKLDVEHPAYRNQIGVVKCSNIGNLTFGGWSFQYAIDVEIIGNDHENPELIKL